MIGNGQTSFCIDLLDGTHLEKIHLNITQQMFLHKFYDDYMISESTAHQKTISVNLKNGCEKS